MNLVEWVTILYHMSLTEFVNLRSFRKDIVRPYDVAPMCEIVKDLYMLNDSDCDYTCFLSKYAVCAINFWGLS